MLGSVGGYSRLVDVLALAQAAYYLVSGFWPLLSMSTFQAVTGPKTDAWLVRTVGLLVAVIGTVLASASLRRAITAEIILLAVASATVLAGIDIVYVAKGRIAHIYLMDAMVEVLLITGWALAAKTRARSTAHA